MAATQPLQYYDLSINVALYRWLDELEAGAFHRTPHVEADKKYVIHVRFFRN